VIADAVPSGALRWEWTWELPAPPEALWPLVSDTNRFNRDTGLPRVEDARDGEELENARRRLRMSVRGVPVAWEELPFEWVRPWRFGVVRTYSRGPLREMRVRATLSPLGEDRSTLVYSVAALPRGVLGWITAKVQIGMLSRRRFAAVFRAYGESVAAGDSSVPSLRSDRSAATNGGEKERLVEAGVTPAVAERLIDFLGRADTLSLARLRPYTLARAWQLPLDEVRSGFLLATRAGLLEMRWELLCPNCRGTKGGATTLSELRASESVHCDTCLIDFSVEFDRSVELVFSPAIGIGPGPDASFCVAGPQITPHIVGQQLLHPGEEREIRARLEPGSYRVRSLAGSGATAFRVSERTDERELRVSWSGEAMHPEGPDAFAEEIHLRLRNDTESEALFVIENTGWSEDALTAAEVAADPRFRDLFASEVLAAGEFVSVGTKTVLFTDLEASTSLYQRIGDAPAFGRVMEHFDVVSAAVEAEGGSVVKTIGDAVMAVFTRPVDALAAVLRARRGLSVATEEECLRIKAGIEEGPAIIVTMNGHLDYFGTTVNVAARLGGLATGEDVIVSDRVQRDELVRALLVRGDVAAEATPFDAEIRGLGSRARVWRIRPRAS